MTNAFIKYKKYKDKYTQLKINLALLQGGDYDKEIYFIRHGKTEWNELGRTQGQEADIELNDIGRNQAEKTGVYLKQFRSSSTDFDCVLSSPLKRCKETAKIICPHINFNKSNITYMDEIKEVKKGSMSGLTNSDELMITLNTLAKNKIEVITDPIEKYKIESPLNNYMFFHNIIKKNNLPINELETYDELMNRTEYLIEYIKNTDCKKILVISHSGYLDILLKTLFNLSTLPKGNMTNGKNCSICYCVLKNNIFTMISPQNTEHLSII